MSQTIIIFLAAWLGSNVAFVAVRLYMTANHRQGETSDATRYPRLVN
jgi:hypothetical protein